MQMAVANNWGPTALIVFGYMAAAFWQNKRVDDLGKRFDDRFEDLKDWIKAEFSRVNDRLDRVEKAIEKLDSRVTVLEEQSRSPLVKR